MQRRMVARIVRDADLVANNQMIENANFASSGFAISSASVVNATDGLAGAVNAAGENSLVVVDGSLGNVFEGDAIVLSEGQVVLGGGTTLGVIGRDSGLQALFTAPGTRPEVSGTDPGTNVFQIANNSSLIGLDISGGKNVVYGNDVNDFMLSELAVSGADESGFYLRGTNTGTISGNAATGNGNNGFEVEIFSGGTISGNTAINNVGFVFSEGVIGGIGFNVGTFDGGTISGNTATGNNGDGFLVEIFTDGTISDNTATFSAKRGFDVYKFNGGTIRNNTATSNGDDGFYVYKFTDGTMSSNTASGNDDGFHMGSFDGRTMSGNAASGNDDGFHVSAFIDGTMSGNTASENTSDGFEITFGTGNTVLFNINSSTSNTLQGYNTTGTPATGVGTNTGSGNGSDDSF